MNDDYVRLPKPSWKRKMLRSSYFWLLLIAFIFFAILWYREGIVMATMAMIGGALFALFVFTKEGRKSRRKSRVIFTCMRCGHNWSPRVSAPDRCPECGTKRWNITQSNIINKRDYTD